jgi:hypothetical protein
MTQGECKVNTVQMLPEKYSEGKLRTLPLPLSSDACIIIYKGGM